MNKNLLIPLLLAASTVVNAAGVVGAASDGTNTADVDSTSCLMVQTSFNLKLSQNVGASWDCSTTAAAVNTGSTKGKNSFGGTTEGGTVSACSTGPDSTNGYGVTVSGTTSGC